MQVFVLNYMVIFLLFKSRNRNRPPFHVFTISPAFTFVMFLIIVSLENVCGKVLTSCSVYTQLNESSSDKKAWGKKKTELWLKLICLFFLLKEESCDRFPICFLMFPSAPALIPEAARLHLNPACSTSRLPYFKFHPEFSRWL